MAYTRLFPPPSLQNGFVQGFIYTLLLTASAKVTNDLDMAPGGEFRNAFNEVGHLTSFLIKTDNLIGCIFGVLCFLGTENTQLCGYSR